MNRKHRRRLILLFILGGILLIAFAGNLVAKNIIRKKIETALQGLPAAFTVTYSSIQPELLAGTLTIRDLHIRVAPAPDTTHRHDIKLDRLSVDGIDYFNLLSSHRVHIRRIILTGCRAELDDYLLEHKLPLPKPVGEGPVKELAIDRFVIGDLQVAVFKGRRKEGGDLTGSVEMDSIHIADVNAPLDSANLHYRDLRAEARELHYTIPGAYERLAVKNLHLDSQEGILTIDSIGIGLTIDREEIGRIKGHQVDCVQGISEGIEVEGLKLGVLMANRFVADRVSIKHNRFHIFRDRRLPLQTDEKPLPVDFLKSLPITIRVNTVKIGTTEFAYEEYPKKGNQTGTLRIERLNGTISPLVNHPREGDPAYMTMVMEGSLMGSGTVTATTKMPLHTGDPYRVEGAFHNLDVTTLNPSAENLGRLHLESGMLNMLDFQFEMSSVESTGQIVGEYHNLVVDKLKENTDEKKIAKLKSFALKEFIIPRDKDKLLPVSKRTGKVKFKRDPSRYFSYYLLHSLLTGVKSSFSLGFLLPG